MRFQGVVVARGCRKRYGWHALSLALCYALALQAILASFGTALAVGNAPATDGVFAICHSDGSTPAGDDNGNPDKLPCALCAVAVVGGGLLPVEAVAPAAPETIGGRVTVIEPIVISIAAPARAGLSRAPPRFA
jgi:hypothetical protein